MKLSKSVFLFVLTLNDRVFFEWKYADCDWETNIHFIFANISR